MDVGVHLCVFFCQSFRQGKHSSIGWVEQVEARGPPFDDADEVLLCEHHPLQLVVDGRPAHPLNDAPREVHDVVEEPMIRAGCVVAGNDQRRGVMGRVRGDEVRVGEDVTNMAPY